MMRRFTAYVSQPSLNEMTEVTKEWLKSIDELQEVPYSQLSWLLRESESREIKAGEFIFEAGKIMKGLDIIVSGSIRLFMLQGGEFRDIAVLESKTITGYLPFSRGKVASISAQASSTSQILFLPAEKMPEMISSYYELTKAMVHVMTSRVRNFTALQQQNEKMMALGKLSAGLAHELNNPASAIVRSAATLKKHLLTIPRTFEDIINIRLSAEQAKRVREDVTSILSDRETPVISMMDRSRLEDSLASWMKFHKIDNPVEIAENFVDYGIGVAEVRALSKQVPDIYLSRVLNWVNTNIVTQKMVTDIEYASKRIADLVGSVKTFTHMDQGHDKQYADIHTGILNTLTMLRYKIHKGNVTVSEKFDKSLPPVNAMIGELNQVWTNLIDNALDAMEDTKHPVLEIITKKDNFFVEVSIVDNGPGVPDEICPRIFDPFFTTKGIGKGTGLGLDVVSKIVKQHRGSVKVKSVPGRTAFVVCFPIDG
jgi:signal transduction histidine kinase